MHVSDSLLKARQTAYVGGLQRPSDIRAPLRQLISMINVRSIENVTTSSILGFRVTRHNKVLLCAINSRSGKGK